MEVGSMGNLLLSKVQAEKWDSKKKIMGATIQGQGGYQVGVVHVF